MRAGDILYTVNGEYITVEQVQHEILEVPVKVYNFRVANNHTYFVGNTAVGVHNTYNKTGKPSGESLYEPTQELKNHLKNGEGTYSKSNGIKGAHNETAFKQQITDFGGKIINKAEIEPGITEYVYMLPRKDGSGIFYNIEYKKTTYNPSVISDEAFLYRAMEAFRNATFDNRHFSGYDSNGLLWEGYIDLAGEIITVYPIRPY